MSNAKTLSTLITIAISEMIDGKRSNLGDVKVPAPSLADFGIDAEPTDTNKDGSLVYATNELNYLYSAILQRTLTKGRNKLEPKSLSLKAGQEFDTTLDALVAPALGGGNPEALKAVAELKKAFRAYLATAGIAEGAQAFLSQRFNDKKIIANDAAAIKGKIEARLEAFAEAAPDALGNSYAMNYFTALAEACSASEISLDDL